MSSKASSEPTSPSLRVRIRPMANNPQPLSPELCTRIANCTRRSDLPALALTSKAFLRVVQPVLYTAVHLSNSQRALLACQSITNSPHIGAHIHTFVLYHSPQRRAPVLTYPFWALVRSAFENMVNLETLVLADPTGNNTWVLEGIRSDILKEMRVRLLWDPTLVKFLARQKLLRHLQCADVPEDVKIAPLVPGSLPALRSFEGSIPLATELLSCQLTHMQLFVDHDKVGQLRNFLNLLAPNAGRHLRGLNLHEIPEDMLSRAVQLIAFSCPNLRHLGIIPLPAQHRRKLHKHLQTLRLHTLEVILTPHRWTTTPYRHPHHQHHHNHVFAPIVQRMLVTELRTYCTTLNTVVMWAGGQRYLWRFVREDSFYDSGEEVWKMCIDWDGGWNFA